MKPLRFCLLLLFLFVSCKKEEVPIITTADISSVDHTSAICGGEITLQGSSGVISRGVCWSTSIDPTVQDSLTIDGSGIGSFTSNITGLEPKTTYFVRAYATNSVGTAYGDEVSFTTINRKFTIVKDINFNIFNVTYVDYNDSLNNYDMECIYSDKRVERIITYNYPSNRYMFNMLTKTMREEYYLNNNGLADSIYYINSDGITSEIYLKLYCTYNADRNLISQLDNYGHSYSYTWTNGNLSRATSNDPTSSPLTYTYTSIENKIDISSFLGSYAGKINRYLVQSVLLEKSMVDPPCAARSVFAYELNSNSLVEKMKLSICDRSISVTKFEYIIINSQ
jgi:hypothetical protein